MLGNPSPWLRRSFPAFAGTALVLASAACDNTGNTGGNGGGGAGGSGPPPAIINLVVDANRDGVANPDGSDEAGEDAYSVTAGASFLANVDDDDEDEIRDCDDEFVPPGADELDLARILVQAWADAPDGTSGTLTIDTPTGDNVRIWRHMSDGSWVLVLGATGCNQTNKLPLDPTEELVCTPVLSYALTADDLRAGLELGIEGRTPRLILADTAWNGKVTLSLAVIDANGAPIEADGAPGGVDTVQMHVAPWMMHGNVSPFTAVHYDGAAYDPFVNDMDDFTAAKGFDGLGYTNWGDQWTQDFMITGSAGIPGPGGTVQGMKIAYARPWGRGAETNANLPLYWLRRNYLGIDSGILEIYKNPWSGDSYDSGGNHDLIPPYTNGTDDYPYGRIIHGSGVLKETKDFYKAQEVQGPPLVIDTSWLIVGHVDESLSYAPANTPRGWKLLVAWPDLAIQELQALQAAGDGGEEFFKNCVSVGAQCPAGECCRWVGNNFVPAGTTIDEVLADTNGVMAWSATCQAEIEAQLDEIKMATGLTDAEIIKFPILFEYDAAYGGHVSWDPGTVNMLVMGQNMAIPRPFAPVVNGVDVWEDFLNNALGTPASELGADGQGMDITYIDDWYGYHINLGEVHCASNPENQPPPAWTWWTKVN